MRLKFKAFLFLLTIQIGCTGMPLFAHPSLPAKASEMHLRRFTGFATVYRGSGGSLETLCSIDLALDAERAQFEAEDLLVERRENTAIAMVAVFKTLGAGFGRSRKAQQMRRRTEMNEILIGKAASEGVVLTVLTDLKNGKIDEAIAGFAEEFRFKDHGIGLEFKDKERLAEFFHKTRELYPDSVLLTDTIFVSEDHVITEWTLQATLTEPFYGQLTRKVRVSVQGASIVRTGNGRITEWADYYGGLTSRRTALASYFTEWVEL